MLKISERNQDRQSVTLRLEGRLVGPWVQELRHLCEPLLATGHRLTLELDEVLFADPAGVALLSQYRQRGVQLCRPAPFLAAQMQPVGTPPRG